MDFEVPQLLNVTQVRQSDGTTISNVDPFPRDDETYWNANHSPGSYCTDRPPGLCGYWLLGADKNGYSTQAVEDGTDDILACSDSLVDHNCYQASGTVTMSRGFHGGKWALARKFWHGILGFLETDGYDPDPNQAAAQTKYRKVVHTTTQFVSRSWFTSTVASSDPSALPPGTYQVSTYAQHFGNVTREVGRYTGIISQSGANLRSRAGNTGRSISTDGSGIGFALEFDVDTYTETACPNVDDLALYDTLHVTPSGLTDLPYVNYTTVTDIISVLVTDGGYSEPVKTPAGWSMHGSYTAPDGTIYAADIDITRTNTLYSCDVVVSVDQPYGSPGSPDDRLKNEYIYQASVELSQPYTAAEFYADALDALAAYNLASDGDYPFRLDEELARATLCLYDEVQSAINPLGFNCPMDNYNAPIAAFGIDPWQSNDPDDVLPWVYDSGAIGRWPPTFEPMDWLDPNNYLWKFGDSYNQFREVTYPGATLLTPLRTGEIISHTAAGSERHFWFGFTKYIQEDLGGPTQWVATEHGGTSHSHLPATAMRWMNDFEAQFDPNASDTKVGNYPQAFIHQQNGQLVIGKYVECKELWPKVNFARPCGPDKYAVDQTTVCCIVGVSGSDYTVKVAGDASDDTASAEPLAAGGLAVGDKIIIKGVGVYPISGITALGEVDGVNQWTINVGSLVDALPTGGIVYGDSRDDVDWLGRARWWTAPGICGRAAISLAYAAGTITITSTDDQPNLRTGEVIDICDASMAVLAASVTLTRVSDNTFTATHADIPGAAYMVVHGVDYTLNDDTPAGTFVQIEWAFNPRAGADGYTSPPTWYADYIGCTGVTVMQKSLAASSCYPSVVGAVPTGSDVFPHAILLGFPSSFAMDEVYSAHWQAAIETTMADPFWQPPFKPNCDVDTSVTPDFMFWSEDDGTGLIDYEDISGGGATLYHNFYAHAPLVEALAAIPSGASLPTGCSLTFDTAANEIPPPYYPSGIPCVDGGGYTSIWRPYGFRQNVCDNPAGRFAANYTYVDCS